MPSSKQTGNRIFRVPGRRRPGPLLAAYASLAAACVCILPACRPETMFVYEMRSSAGADWKLTPMHRNEVLHATARTKDLKISVMTGPRNLLEDAALRMAGRRSAGEMLVQPFRVIIFKERNGSASPDELRIDFSRFVLKHGNEVIEQISYADFEKCCAHRDLIDYRWMFGAKSIEQLELPLPDYLKEPEEDTASEEEKSEQKKSRIAAFKPWADPVLKPGDMHAAWLIFPVIDIETDYTLAYREPGIVPELPVRLAFVRRERERLEGMDVTDEERAILSAEREALLREREDGEVMHEQLRRHDELKEKLTEDQNRPQQP